jgi:hypothetical protein
VLLVGVPACVSSERGGFHVARVVKHVGFLLADLVIIRSILRGIVPKERKEYGSDGE